MAKNLDAEAVRAIVIKKLAHIPLRELAGEIGCSVPYLSMMARGEREPSAELLSYLGLVKRIVYTRLP